MSGWVAGMGQPMINADAALDLFDVDAGALCCAAAIPCHGDETRMVVTLYADRGAAFNAHHERLVAAALSLLTSRQPYEADNVDLRRRPLRGIGPAKSHVLH